MSQVYFIVALAIVSGITLYACVAESSPNGQQVGLPLMNTNIALVGADPLETSVHSLNNVVVDPSRLMDQARKGYNKEDDIEEDENDRFIASRKGKLRPRFATAPGSEDWAEELAPVKRVLSRFKRSKDVDHEEDYHKKSKQKRERKVKVAEDDKKIIKDKRYRARGNHQSSRANPSTGFSEHRRLKSNSKHPQVIYLIDSDQVDTGTKFLLSDRKSAIKNRSRSRLVNENHEGIVEADDDNSDKHSVESKKEQEEETSSGVTTPIIKNLRKVRVLSRQKRCGGGGGDDDDDDDGDANRSRRARRTRRNRARKARRKAAKARKRAEKAAQTTTTTVTRRVIQDGQVVSETGATQAACNQPQVIQQQPVILQQQPAPATVVQNGAPQIVQTVPGQPIVQSAAPAQPIVQNVAPAQPVVQQVAAAPAAPAAPAASATGSLQGSAQQGASVEGSLKISS